MFNNVSCSFVKIVRYTTCIVRYVVYREENYTNHITYRCGIEIAQYDAVSYDLYVYRNTMSIIRLTVLGKSTFSCLRSWVANFNYLAVNPNCDLQSAKQMIRWRRRWWTDEQSRWCTRTLSSELWANTLMCVNICIIVCIPYIDG